MTALTFGSQFISDLHAAGLRSKDDESKVKKIFKKVRGKAWGRKKTSKQDMLDLREQLKEEEERVREDKKIARTEKKREKKEAKEAKVEVTGKFMVITCECGNKRQIKPQDAFQVKRCVDCQDEFARERRRLRSAAKRAEKKGVVHTKTAKAVVKEAHHLDPMLGVGVRADYNKKTKNWDVRAYDPDWTAKKQKAQKVKRSMSKTLAETVIKLSKKKGK